MRPPNLPGYGAAALVAITGVAGGEREAAMGIAAAVGPSPQVRGRWIKMAEALPRPASCVCVLLFTLLLCTRVRVVFVLLLLLLPLNLLWSLSLFPLSSPLSPLPSSLSLLPHAGLLMPMLPCSGSDFSFLVSHSFSQPTSFLTNLLVSPRGAPCASPLSLLFF